MGPDEPQSGQFQTESSDLILINTYVTVIACFVTSITAIGGATLFRGPAQTVSILVGTCILVACGFAVYLSYRKRGFAWFLREGAIPPPSGTEAGGATLFVAAGANEYDRFIRPLEEAVKHVGMSIVGYHQDLDVGSSAYKLHRNRLNNADACAIIYSAEVARDKELRDFIVGWVEAHSERAAVRFHPRSVDQDWTIDPRFKTFDFHSFDERNPGSAALLILSAVLDKASQRGFQWKRNALLSRSWIVRLSLGFLFGFLLFLAAVVSIRFRSLEPTTERGLLHSVELLHQKDTLSTTQGTQAVLHRADERLQRLMWASWEINALKPDHGPSVWVTVDRGAGIIDVCEAIVGRSSGERTHCRPFKIGDSYPSYEDLGIVGCSLRHHATVIWEDGAITSDDESAGGLCKYGRAENDTPRRGLLCMPLSPSCDEVGEASMAAMCMSVRSPHFLSRPVVRAALEEYAAALSAADYTSISEDLEDH